MAKNGYDLSRAWFNWSFENPEKVSPNHTALYFFCIENCNRLGWKEKFRMPASMAMEAIGMRSYNTYIKTLLDLVDFGFITIIERSKNQYSANIIALSNFDRALDKALDKALITHSTKQSERTVESIDSIDKQQTTNNKQQTTNKSTAPAPVILQPDEIKWKLLEEENEMQLFICQSYGFTKENFPRVVAIFIGEKTAGVNELNKPYPEVVIQFKCWVKYNRKKLLQQFQDEEIASEGPGYGRWKKNGNQKQTAFDILEVCEMAKYRAEDE